MDPVLLGAAIGILGVAGFFIWVILQDKLIKNKENNKKAASVRCIAILVITAILTVILLGAWVTGPSYEKREICGSCGGDGLFMGKSCKWCHSTGYEKETVYENWWCFWMALVVLGSGVFLAYKAKG